MKKGILLIFAFLFVGSYFSQMTKPEKKQLEQAQIFLEEGNYIDAYDYFWELFEAYPENTDIQYGVGLCKLNRRGEEKSALPFLLNAQADKKNTEALYYLGIAYHMNHRLDEAILSFETYKSQKKILVSLSEVNRHIQSSMRAKELIEKPLNVRITNLGENINTADQESVPVILPNGKGLFFTSRRPGSVGGKKDHLGNYFQDIYFSTFDNMKWQTPENVEMINSDLHDASVSISHNGSTFISYRTNKDNITGGDLYYTSLKDSVWGKTTKFSSSVNTEYQELSATLSPDENTLYFSSNRPGGYGGSDIYKVQKLPTGDWGEAMNLGPTVNTSGNEDAPFIHADGKTLYFSSDGFIGMGGYDIYKSTLGENKMWSTPENIGYPINTVEHDIYFTLSPDGTTAYYSSERPGGFGKEDIYEIKILDEDNFNTVVNCKALDELMNKPVGAKVTLIDERTHRVNGIYQSNNGSGKFIMVVIPDNLYQVVIEANGFESQVLYMSFSEGDTSPDELQEFKLKKKS